jgi:hypothetical protein
MASTFLDRAREASARILQRISDAVRPSTLPPSPFEAWEYEDAEDAIDDALERQTIDVSESSKPQNAPGSAVYPDLRAQLDPIAMNRAFYDGDHWQNGGGWIGPHPATTDVGFADAMSEISLAFTSTNKVREVVERHALGVVGRAWQWGWVPRRDLKKDETPTKAEQTAIEEATALSRQWMKARKVSSLVRDAVCTLVLAERAAARLLVPAGLGVEDRNGETRVTAASIEEALGKIYVEHDRPDVAAVVTDPDTRLECGVWLYEATKDEDDDVDDAENVIDYAGITYLDETGRAVVRLTPEESDDVQGVAPVEAVLDLGGRLPMFEMRRKALITPQVQQQQRALNLAETMIPRNIVTGGFLERIILEGQLPGEPEVDPETGKKTGRWLGKPFFTGAGTTNFIAAVEHEQEDGSIVVGQPQVVFREPIKPDASISASDKHYRSILDETSQLHVIMNGDSDPSGKSRIEARAEYVKSLLLTQPEAEALIAFIIETSMAMAEHVANRVGQYTEQLRVQVACRLDIGPLNADERTAFEASIGKTLSRESAMMMLGVEDIDAELARMSADPYARAMLGKAVGDALTSLTTAGATLDGAAAYVGIEGEQLKALLTPASFEPTPPTVPGTPPNTPPPASGAKDPAQQRTTPDNGRGNSGPSNRSGNGKSAPARSTSSSGSSNGGGAR